MKNWLIRKDPDAGKDWRQEEKGMREDEVARWHPWLDGRESGWTPGVGDGQGGLVCCDSWGCKELNTTKWLNWTWPPHGKSWLTGKDPDAGRHWGQEEKGTTEDEMAGWHHRLYGHVWVNSRSWWWTGRLGMLRFTGWQRVRHDWATELNWTELITSWVKQVYFEFLKMLNELLPFIPGKLSICIPLDKIS